MTNKISQGPVDLFGNSTLTPRQIMQQQLTALIDSASKDAAGDTRMQGVATMGAAFGGMLRSALIDKGVLPKPPEVEAAERRETARKKTQEDAQAQGISPVDNPEDFADLAAANFLQAGDEGSALMALQWKDLRKASARKAELDAATVAAKGAAAMKDLKETEQMGEKLELARRGMADKEKRTALLGRLTQVKESKTGPGHKVVEIVEGYLKRADAAEAAGKKVPDFTAKERRALAELQKTGFMDRIMLNTVPGMSDAAPGGASSADNIIDLSSN
jgi:hypothetical protein